MYAREHSLAMYQPGAYYLSNMLIDIPASLLSTAIWTLISYPTLPLRMELQAVLVYLLVMFFSIDFFVALAQAIAAVASTVELAMGCICTMVCPLLMFSGVPMLPRDMPPFVFCLYLLSPIHYFWGALMVNEFAHNPQYPIMGYQELEVLDLMNGDHPQSLSWLVLAAFAQWASMRIAAFFVQTEVEHRKH